MIIRQAILSLTCLLAFTFANSQSIPSHWMNVYGLENYHATKDHNVSEIIVNKTGYYSSGRSFKEKWTYAFLPGRIVGEYFRESELKKGYVQQFDSLNRMTRNTVDARYPGIGWSRVVYTYQYLGNGKNNEIHYNAANKPLFFVYFENDSLGNPTRISTGSTAGEISAYETAEYDYESGTYEYKIFRGDGEMIRQETNYCNMDTTQFRKNEQGDLVRIIWPTASPADRVFHLFEYEYDEMGNWIKRKRTLVSGSRKETLSVVKRKIKYQ